MCIVLFSNGVVCDRWDKVYRHRVSRMLASSYAYDMRIKKKSFSERNALQRGLVVCQSDLENLVTKGGFFRKVDEMVAEEWPAWSDDDSVLDDAESDDTFEWTLRCPVRSDTLSWHACGGVCDACQFKDALT